MEAEHGHGHGATRKGAGAASCAPKAGEEFTLKLRIAGIFIILTTSSIGVLGPILLRRIARLDHNGIVFTAIKQFGTGVIISTVFIHLLMHAFLQFANPCVAELEYEGTSMAIAMGGAFISFLIDYAGIQWLAAKAHRHALPNASAAHRSAHSPTTQSDEKSRGAIQASETIETPGLDIAKSNRIDKEKLSVTIMEGGIIFHSILVGVLLTVTPDDEYLPMFAVVLMHQLFEGLALGARIEPLEQTSPTRKLLMGLAFSGTCPAGMAIGIGVRRSFNGNDKNTILTLGTMDALSAGVLAWVGFVELWSADWLHGDLRTPGRKKGAVAMVSLLLGAMLMSVLGKWA